MAEEIHTTRDAAGNTHTTTIVDRDAKRGGGGLIMGAIALIALAVLAFLAFEFLGNDRVETQAISDAAQKVGSAAEDVGQAAHDAVK
ncbi:hypothetical protein [Sphingopyxis sp. MWB1]|uniref:hypothetical protein n=1 Tax=Sphingopyxis sp. MWB1 TaxID=1537715 RepID=UPI00051A25D4|nr:hypothetical protein [Sphingopyxis sp. MWB1]